MKLGNKFNGIGTSKTTNLGTPSLYVGDNFWGTGGSTNTMTFTNLDIGPPASNRKVIITSVMDTGSSFGTTGAYLDGTHTNDMTEEIGYTLNTIYRSKILSIPWPTGTTANVSYYISSTSYDVTDVLGQVYAVYTSANNSTDAASDQISSGTINNLTIDIPADGAVFAQCWWELPSANTTRTWTGVDTSAYFGGIHLGQWFNEVYHEHMYQDNLTTETGRTIQIETPNIGYSSVLTAISWNMAK